MRRSSIDLDKRELLDGMEAQGSLQELALASADAVGANLHLIESELARMTPGEHVKEAAEPAAVRCQQALEDLDQPDRCSGFRDGPYCCGREPLRPQLATERIHPDSVPAIVPQVIQDGEFSA
jgi:hypothetical protein